MDPLTHALAGAAVASSASRGHLPKEALWLLPLVAMLPDIDLAAHIINLNDIGHRTWTHALVMVPVVTLLLSLLLFGLRPYRLRDYPLVPWFIGAAFTSHLVLDMLTAPGVMMLLPFSQAKLSADLIFGIDPLFTLLLLIPLSLALLLPKLRQLLAIFGLVAVSAYSMLAFASHQQALDLARHARPDAPEFAALPMPFSPFHWQMIAIYPESYQVATLDLLPEFHGTQRFFPNWWGYEYNVPLGRPTALQWSYFPALSSLRSLADRPWLGRYIENTRFPTVLHYDEKGVEIGDLTYGHGILRQGPIHLRMQAADKALAPLNPQPNPQSNNPSTGVHP